VVMWRRISQHQLSIINGENMKAVTKINNRSEKPSA
jgi:hypothetical protein